jgi:ABC-type Fe3+ transport system substrate-binding protein
MANNPQWVRGHLGAARAVASGQAAATFDTMTNVTLGMKKNNQPTDVAFSNIDPLPIWPQTAAIFKDAPHPNAAKLYITWFLATSSILPPGQRIVFAGAGKERREPLTCF